MSETTRKNYRNVSHPFICYIARLAFELSRLHVVPTSVSLLVNLLKIARLEKGGLEPREALSKLCFQFFV